jgi:hypothetical protein
VKTHFYNIWIQLKVLRKTKELRRLHDILSQVSFHVFFFASADRFKMRMPTYMGRLPTLMGAPAGGSLTADQWLITAIAALPVMVLTVCYFMLKKSDPSSGSSNMG